ncbi:hypothetical protein ST201phi2-1p318 [Pseudomonas phage 201phi2-1]|uniref:Uncharacterized protein n=1 Tax=Pseudomonas phage 201phi2-1 TaxID=198110 RepID=B3FJH8_BP201|nr:hypothetical protein ST201phi2-1p318 [Pseudomonas phage 201phi2-1]ABY63143.1 hypothetical protein 201phi2-1p318 [Pseudomonas phage 201phi2-1]
MSNMDRIAKFARRLETSISTGGCPIDKLFMTACLVHSNYHIVEMDPEVNAKVVQADVAYKLVVEVTMCIARPEHESKWRWEPNKYDSGVLLFYHYDFDALLAYVADYLEAHHDTMVPAYMVNKATETRRAYFVKCLKHAPIGRVKHITDDPDYLSEYKVYFDELKNPLEED